MDFSIILPTEKNAGSFTANGQSISLEIPNAGSPTCSSFGNMRIPDVGAFPGLYECDIADIAQACRNVLNGTGGSCTGSVSRTNFFDLTITLRPNK